MSQPDTILILQASKQPYLAIGIRYGGIKLNGHEYHYLPLKDAYIRQDYQKVLKKQMKEGKSWEDFIEFVKSIK